MSKFIYGFNHDGFVYFLTVQNNTKLKGVESRLARICDRDQNPFSSYTEIPIECSNGTILFHEARTARLDFDTKSLYVSFEQGQIGRPQSVVCTFRMADLKSKFEDAVKDCAGSHLKTGLLEKFLGDDYKRGCKEVVEKVNSLESLMCGEITTNRFIYSRDPIVAEPCLHLQNGIPLFFLTSTLLLNRHSLDRITSLLSSFTTAGHQTLLVGTETGRIVNVDLAMNQIRYVNRLSRSAILPNPALVDQTVFLANNETVFRLTVDICQQYSSCSSCFASQHCRWLPSGGGCQYEPNNHQTPICKPEVYDFWPKRGPKQGGTRLTFVGTNFGEIRASKSNSRVEINIGQYQCELLHRTDTRIECRINSTTSDFEDNCKRQFFPQLKIFSFLYFVFSWTNQNLCQGFRGHWEEKISYRWRD